jgi:glutamate racemase
MRENKNFMEKPIGIFDSGVGGLTVVKEVIKLLPHESIIYFGDTARVPYGTKSKETITRFAIEDASFLIKKDVKAIVVACNSVSSNSLDHLMENFSVPIIGVIEPGVINACKKTVNKKIGVIGTDATIESNAYRNRIKELCPESAVFCKSCPLFVPLAEEGWVEEEVSKLAAKKYLHNLLEKGIDTLVLGCTHYPILKGVIQNVAGEEVYLVDSAFHTAHALKELLESENLLKDNRSPRSLHFFLSDIPRRFSEIGERFLGAKIENISVVDITTDRKT